MLVELELESLSNFICAITMMNFASFSWAYTSHSQQRVQKGKLSPLVNYLVGNQSWIFIERTDAEAETPILWPPDAKSWLISKDLDAGKDRGQEEKGMTEDEMVGWHHWLNGHGFGWTPRVGDRQGGLACYGSWGRKELDMTERLNWTELSLSRRAFNQSLAHFLTTLPK